VGSRDIETTCGEIKHGGEVLVGGVAAEAEDGGFALLAGVDDVAFGDMTATPPSWFTEARMVSLSYPLSMRANAVALRWRTRRGLA
jgi:hypothetical protein